MLIRCADILGHFLIPIVAYLDAVEMTKLCGDKEMNPINMSVANIDDWVRQKPSMGPIRAIALLPTRSKYTGSESADEKFTLRVRYNEVMQEVIADTFSELPKLYEEGMEIVCPDGGVRTGHPILCGWIADYCEYEKLFSLTSKSCPCCHTAQRNNGLELHPTKTNPARSISDLDEKVKNWRFNEKLQAVYNREGQRSTATEVVKKESARRFKEATAEKRKAQKDCEA